MDTLRQDIRYAFRRILTIADSETQYEALVLANAAPLTAAVELPLPSGSAANFIQAIEERQAAGGQGQGQGQVCPPSRERQESDRVSRRRLHHA